MSWQQHAGGSRREGLKVLSEDIGEISDEKDFVFPQEAEQDVVGDCKQSMHQVITDRRGLGRPSIRRTGRPARPSTIRR